MDAKKVAKFIVNGYVSNKELFDKLFVGGLVIALCKILKVPVALKSDGVSIFDADYYEDHVTDKELVMGLPWTNSPSITAIYHLTEGAKRKSFDSQKRESAKKIYDIAYESIDDNVKSYAINALSQISKCMSFDSSKSVVDNYIAELAEEII